MESFRSNSRDRQQSTMSKTKVSPIRMTPLLVVGAFISLTEVVVGIAAAKTSGTVQNWLIGFVYVFPVLIAVAFFVTLWTRPFVFYTPGDFGATQDVSKYVEAMRGTPKKGELTASSTLERKEAQIEAAKPPAENATVQAVLPESEAKNNAPEEKKSPKKPDDLKIEMVIAFMEGKKDEAERIFEELKSVERDAKTRKEHEVTYYFARARFAQDTHAFAELNKFAKDQEVCSLAFFYTGVVYQNSKDYEKAASAFESSMINAPENDLAARLVRSAECYVSDGQPMRALEILKSKLTEFTKAEHLATVYVGMAEAFKNTGNKEFQVFALEKAVELKPNDTDLRFRIAWAYSDQGRKKMALLHYSTLKTFQKDGEGMLNNLGVECERFDLNIRAVRYYKQAFELKNTLAGANLAYQYMNAGFYAEAKETLEKAKAYPDVHPNVGSAIAALSKMEEDENEKARELNKQGLEEQKFLKVFAEAYFVNDASPTPFAGQWLSENGEQLVVAQMGSRISAEWTHDKKMNELSGDVSNRGAKFKRKTGAEKMQLLSILGTSETSGYIYVSKDGKTMRWLTLDGDEISFSNFTKQS